MRGYFLTKKGRFILSLLSSTRLFTKHTLLTFDLILDFISILLVFEKKILSKY